MDQICYSLQLNSLLNFSCSLNLSFLAIISNCMAGRPLLQYCSYAFFPLSLHSKLLSYLSLFLQKTSLQQRSCSSFFTKILHSLILVKMDYFIRWALIYVQPRLLVHYFYFIKYFWTHFYLLLYFPSFSRHLIYQTQFFFEKHESFPYQSFCCLFSPAFLVLLSMHSIFLSQTHWNVGMP